MLNYELRRDEGILVLTPDGALEASDSKAPTSHVDAYLELWFPITRILAVHETQST